MKPEHSIPENYSEWRHIESGAVYIVITVSNTTAVRGADKWPAWVTFAKKSNGEVFSRPLNSATLNGRPISGFLEVMEPKT